MVIVMQTATMEVNIRALRKLFVTHGLPDVLVSDNGAQLTAREFETFLAERGIKHALIALYRPVSNGQVERLVRVTKETLTRMGPGNWQEKVDAFLLVQHITPSTITQKSPAELLMGRRLRSRLDQLHPDYNPDTQLTPPTPKREFKIGDLVFAHNYAGQPAWVKATVTAITGPKSYKVELEDGRLWRRHINQLRSRWGESKLRK